jgi:hypothetical protein
MLPTILFAVSLAFQDHASLGSPDPMEIVEKLYESEAQQQAFARAQNRMYDSFLEQRFQRKFNGLAKALLEFGQSWNRSHEFDPAQMDRLEKAWRDLAKADRWFNTSAGE